MNKIKTYTAIDFQQYHAGKMHAKDMHALEKAALEDPFLADALEGYEYAIKATIEIEKIKEKIPPYNEEEKIAVVPINKKLWMRVAASVALFMGVGYLFFNLNNKKEVPSIAKEKVALEQLIDSNKIVQTDSAFTLNATTEGNIAQNTLKPVDIVIQMEPLNAPQDFISTYESNGSYNYTPAPSTAAISSDKEVAPSAVEMKDQISEKLDDAKMDDSRTDSINYRKEVAKNLRIDNRSQNLFENNSLSNNNVTQNGYYNSYNFSGIVKTPAGGPMQNATIKMRNSNLVTRTDNNGRFNFVAADSIATVSVIASGYVNRDLQLTGLVIPQGTTTNSAVANMNAEVVVASNAVAKKRVKTYDPATVNKEELAKNKSTVNVENALNGKVPGLNVETKENDKLKDLWGNVKQVKIDSVNFNIASKNFNTYVIKNIVPQFDEKGIEYKGKVVLSFITNKKGIPRKIKIEKSLNKKCDAHAKQLLLDGPAWEINTNTRNTVTIDF